MDVVPKLKRARLSWCGGWHRSGLQEVALFQISDKSRNVGGRPVIVDPELLDESGNQLELGARRRQALPEHPPTSVQLEVDGTFEIEDDDFVARNVPGEPGLPEAHDYLPRVTAGTRPGDCSCELLRLPPVSGDDGSLYVMSPIEIVFGAVLGHVGSSPASSSPLSDPRAALEHVVREALLRPPCGVAFSGGRDSSVVLAVATHVARRDGLAEPIPLTKVFTDVPSAEESNWQELVIRHLRLSDWELVSIDDELDLVGPLATANLVEHGVVWPPMIHGDVPVLERLGAGSLIDGEGGDEVFGVAAHRIAPVTRLLRAPRPLQWRRVRRALGALAPVRLRARHVVRQLNDRPMPWLRPAALAALGADLVELERETPLSFPASLRLVPRRRAQVLGARNRRRFARLHGVDVSSPLLHPDVVDALARRGGIVGPGDRSAVLRALFPDLLPDSVLGRTSKATFNAAFWGRHTRHFAEGWSGGGVDAELVDPDVLRSVWISEQRQPITAALLQQAWLSDHLR
jgi:hypothetical protein